MAKRLTGISTSFGGLQWETVEGDKDVARQAIIFLEDRRLLFGERYVEDEMHCVTSALQIRAFLTQQIEAARPGKTLEGVLRSMRAACRQFVDRAGPEAANFRHRDPNPHTVDPLSLALGDLRTVMGLAIATMAEKFDLPVEEDLAAILPPTDDGDSSWIPGFYE
ncbi:DUF6650 family protein [Actinoallomurus acaciae]|uniref:DUF6650 family protein n=1 Tax=Actinoallomurus acaciae TaxID=502577 RepID=A0ABV5YCA8_9ACTN